MPSSCQNNDCYIRFIQSGGLTTLKGELGISKQIVSSQDVTLTRANNACGLSALPTAVSVLLTGPCSLNTAEIIASSSAAASEINKSV
ncbi:unnamed protein product [Trichobilharzia szidati]|nr:unnamed protein product [Trichobilharzia szidati]